MRIELFLDGLNVLDGVAVALVDLLNVMRVGDEFLKRARGQQQRQDVRAAGLVAGDTRSERSLRFFLSWPSFIDPGLRVVNLALDILDVVEGLGILVGQRRILICDAVELGPNLVELGLGGIQFIGGFFGSLRRMGASGQAKRTARSGAEQGLEGSAARELLGKGWNRCLVTYVPRYMLIYMSLNSYILAYIWRVPTISTNGKETARSAARKQLSNLR